VGVSAVAQAKQKRWKHQSQPLTSSGSCIMCSSSAVIPIHTSELKSAQQIGVGKTFIFPLNKSVCCW
jgi:hypothetical protein